MTDKEKKIHEARKKIYREVLAFEDAAYQYGVQEGMQQLFDFLKNGHSLEEAKSIFSLT
jgi:hypothetical protein